MTRAEPVKRFKGEYHFLSNFSPCSVDYDGMTYRSVEHAYVATKTTDKTERLQIQAIESAGMVKRFGRKLKLRSDWEDIKLSVMEDLVRQKFTKDKWYTDKLLGTGQTTLIEGNTWGDTFWGVCNGLGQNHLGIILMKIRQELQEQQSKQELP